MQKQNHKHGNPWTLDWAKVDKINRLGQATGQISANVSIIEGVKIGINDRVSEATNLLENARIKLESVRDKQRENLPPPLDELYGPEQR